MRSSTCLHWFVALLVVLLTSTTLAAAGPFDVNGKQPARVLVLPPDTPIPIPLPRPDAPVMQARASGVVHELSAEERRALRAAGAGASVVPLAPEARVALRLVLVPAQGEAQIVEISRTDQGVVAARALTSTLPEGRAFQVRAAAIGELALGWNPGGPPAAKARPAAHKLGESFTVDEPLAPSWVHLDVDTMRTRLNLPADTRARRPERRLAQERMVARLPATFDPRRPVGLLVFNHALPEAIIPESIRAAADELGFICIAPGNVGNDRPTPDRYQLALDAIQTARERWFIDDERVYLTGLSGGGKVSTHVWAACPDIVRGIVPVVAISTYENIRRDDGKYWQGDYPKPTARRMRELAARRVAAVTGGRDFNHDYIVAAVAHMNGAGLSAKLFDYPDMRHEMPTPERFADALRWVDEPARTATMANAARAEQMLAAAHKLKGAARAEALERVLREAPWTEAAWQAFDELHAAAAPAAP